MVKRVFDCRSDGHDSCHGSIKWKLTFNAVLRTFGCRCGHERLVNTVGRCGQFRDRSQLCGTYTLDSAWRFFLVRASSCLDTIYGISSQGRGPRPEKMRGDGSDDDNGNGGGGRRETGHRTRVEPTETKEKRDDGNLVDRSKGPVDGKTLDEDDDWRPEGGSGSEWNGHLCQWTGDNADRDNAGRDRRGSKSQKRQLLRGPRRLAAVW